MTRLYIDGAVLYSIPDIGSMSVYFRLPMRRLIRYLFLDTHNLFTLGGSNSMILKKLLLKN